MDPVSRLDPDSMGSLDPYPDPDSQSGSGCRRAKMTHKNPDPYPDSLKMLDPNPNSMTLITEI